MDIDEMNSIRIYCVPVCARFNLHCSDSDIDHVMEQMNLSCSELKPQLQMSSQIFVAESSSHVAYSNNREGIPLSCDNPSPNSPPPSPLHMFTLSLPFEPPCANNNALRSSKWIKRPCDTQGTVQYPIRNLESNKITWEYYSISPHPCLLLWYVHLIIWLRFFRTFEGMRIFSCNE